MVQKKYYKIGIFLLILFLISFETEAAPKFSSLDQVVQEFESQNSKSSVVLMEIDSGKVVYVYRPEIAISKKLPPGSLVKTFSALTLLKYKNQFGYSPEKKIECRGRFYPPQNIEPNKSDLSSLHLPKDENGKEYLRCSLAKGHGRMDLRSALIQSCNVYFLTSASLNAELFYSKLNRDWGLGKSTRSRLDPYLEPSESDHKPSSLLKKVTASIGEGGVHLSPLKIAQLYASIWDGGPRLSPFWNEKEKPLRIEENPFDGRNLRWITNVLSEVPENGTLKGLKKYNENSIEIIGGKTGTGTKFLHKYETHGWTVLSFRKDKRSYVMTVFVEKGSGGNQAKSLASLLLDRIDSNNRNVAIKSGKSE
ncbi:penicillin-binding transpeptidase domain-containing protein [Leptospira sarikeiensis]|uniref:beta-lactamase n=1 Tax=Leptospira sarikeiensis TaxID=2484943 RepID=A0A4R9K444_9LEPT|nr:penicillin-binding transpeptidase domain-containing protein [Leptospira sarikeiensis]TGL60869.1 cell division protein FtsI [Leptospira sarikeiensis]